MYDELPAKELLTEEKYESLNRKSEKTFVEVAVYSKTYL